MAQALTDDSVIVPVLPIREGLEGPLATASAAQRRRLADDTTAWFARNQVNFGVSIEGQVVQRPIPYDPLPRVVDSVAWAWLED